MQHHAQTFVGAHSFRGVPLLLEGLHQNAVARLAIWSKLDELASARFRLCQRRPAQPESRSCEAFEPAQPDIAEAPSPVVDPRKVVTLEQRTTRDVVCDTGGAPRLSPLAAGGMGIRPVDALERSLDVDERVGG